MATKLAAVFSQHDAEPLCDRLLAAGLPAGPVQSIDQALTSAHRSIAATSSKRTGTGGWLRRSALTRSKRSLRNVPPQFSQHTAEVLTEFGYSRNDIDALIAEGVVCGANAGAKAALGWKPAAATRRSVSRARAPYRWPWGA